MFNEVQENNSDQSVISCKRSDFCMQ